MSPNKPQRTKNNPSSGKKQDEGEEESTKRHVYIEPGVKVDLVDDLKQQQKASEDKTTAHQQKELLWVKISAALIFVYVGLTAWQSCLSRTAITDAREHFVKDQRPYIWTVRRDVPFIKLGEQVAWNFSYTNYGKSPAVGVAFRCQIRLHAHDTAELKDMYAPIHAKGYWEEGSIIPPGDTSNFSTCYSEERITNEDLETFKNFDAGAVLHVFFEYYDTGGNRYTTTMCIFTRRPGAAQIGICPTDQQIR